MEIYTKTTKSILIFWMATCLAIFLPCSLYAAQPANSDDCKSIFQKVISDAIVLAKPKIGKPSFLSESFDIRVVGRSALRSPFSPSELLAKSKQVITGTIDKLNNLGFPVQSYTQVLVESNPGAVAHLTFGQKGRFVWVNEKISTPWVSNARELVGLPNFFGGRTLFVGRGEQVGGGFPKILYLPALDSTHHSIDNSLLVAHEIAHLTEPQGGTLSEIWREARADTLGYLATGNTDIHILPNMKVEIPDLSGNVVQKEVNVVRSIRTPSVESVPDVIPHVAAYHYNSQVISNVLYELSQKKGNEFVAKFIRWMDTAGMNDPIPKILMKTDNAPAEQAESTILVTQGNADEARGAIEKSLRFFGKKMRKWAESEHLDAATKQLIEQQLVKRGI